VRESTVANEWRQEGRIEARQENILKLLDIRFHANPSEIVAHVNATQDYNRLLRWFKLAATADSIAAFQAAMDE